MPTPKQRAVTLKREGLDDGVIGAILGLSSADVRSLIFDADPSVGPLGYHVFDENVTVPANADWTDGNTLALGSFAAEPHNLYVAQLFLQQAGAQTGDLRLRVGPKPNGTGALSLFNGTLDDEGRASFNGYGAILDLGADFEPIADLWVDNVGQDPIDVRVRVTLLVA